MCMRTCGGAASSKCAEGSIPPPSGGGGESSCASEIRVCGCTGDSGRCGRVDLRVSRNDHSASTAQAQRGAQRKQKARLLLVRYLGVARAAG